MMSTIGFLHTADVHRATFAALVGELAPGAGTVHVVDRSLLADAREQGTIDDALRARLLTGGEQLRRCCVHMLDDQR